MDKQTTTRRWDPNAKGPGKGGYVSETQGRALGNTEDFQSTAGLAAAARNRAKKPKTDETVDDQTEALSTPRKRKVGY